MNALDVVTIIRDSSEYAKQHGLELVRIYDLENLLSEIEKIIANNLIPEKLISNEITLAKFKAEHESSLAHFRAVIDTKIEAFKSL